MENIKKYVAEFFGTFVLVFIACGAAMNGAPHTSVALAFGLVIVAMAYSIGDISGCHINPAVSIAMFIDGRLSAQDTLCYMAAQFLGGIAGAGALAGIAGNTNALSRCSNGYTNANLQDVIPAALALEIILTFIFVFVILRVTSKAETSKSAGLIIGATLTLVHIIGINFTGTSVNPARSFGPALLAGGKSIEQVWLFLVAPLVGGILAALAVKLLKKSEN